MKTVLTVLGVGLGMAVVGLAEPVKPRAEPVRPNMKEQDFGLYVSPETGLPPMKPGQDAMLQRLMKEMLKEGEDQWKEMKAPVELPKLDAPELQRLLREGEPTSVPTTQRWLLGVILRSIEDNRIVVNAVRPKSAAEEAGLASGDEIRDVNGIQLRDHAMLVDLLQVIRDQEVVLGVKRFDEELKIKIKARQMEVPRLLDWGIAPPEIKSRTEVLPPVRIVPEQEERDDEILKELRGMRGLMEEMLKELKKPKTTVVPNTSKPRVRYVPTSPKK